MDDTPRRTPPADWSEIVRRSSAIATTAEPRVAELLSYLAPAATYCRRIFNHANRLTEESATATVALYLVIQAYRATAATARLALAGYADIAAGVARSVWEIQLRLARTRRGGELVAVADLYMSVNHEIKLREAGIAQDGDEEDRRVRDTWIAGREELVSKAEALGSNESELRKIGRATVADLAKEEDLQSEYNIWGSATP